jgi:hypothetical protein
MDGAADRGANVGRDGRACGKREEGPGSDQWTGQLTAPLSSQARGRKGEKKLGGGVWTWGCHVAWGLAPTSGRRLDRVPAAARAGGALLFGQRRAGADARAPNADGRGSEKREARCAWAGPGRKRVGRAWMNSIVLDLFKLIQMSSK